MLNEEIDLWSKDIPCWERGILSKRFRPLDPDLLFGILLEVKTVFDKHGLVFWLSHGTALAAYRDNQFILHDDDADIGMNFEQRPFIKPAIEELRNRGFYIPLADFDGAVDNENPPYWDAHMIKNGEKVEAWFFRNEKETWVYDPIRCGINTLRHPAEFYNTLDKLIFRGVEFNVPHNIEKYLEMMYGKGWKTPDPNKKYNNNPLGIQ